MSLTALLGNLEVAIAQQGIAVLIVYVVLVFAACALVPKYVNRLTGQSVDVDQASHRWSSGDETRAEVVQRAITQPPSLSAPAVKGFRREGMAWSWPTDKDAA